MRAHGLGDLGADQRAAEKPTRENAPTTAPLRNPETAYSTATATMIQSTIVMAASVRQHDERAGLAQRLVDCADEFVSSGRGSGERARDGLAVRYEGNSIAGEADDLQIVRSSLSLVFQVTVTVPGWTVTVDGSNRYRSSTTMVTLCLPLTTDAVSDPVLGRRWIAFLVFEQDIAP